MPCLVCQHRAQLSRQYSIPVSLLAWLGVATCPCCALAQHDSFLLRRQAEDNLRWGWERGVFWETSEATTRSDVVQILVMGQSDSDRRKLVRLVIGSSERYYADGSAFQHAPSVSVKVMPWDHCKPATLEVLDMPVSVARLLRDQLQCDGAAAVLLAFDSRYYETCFEVQQQCAAVFEADTLPQATFAVDLAPLEHAASLPPSWELLSRQIEVIRVTPSTRQGAAPLVRRVVERALSAVVARTRGSSPHAASTSSMDRGDESKGKTV